jgi:hypothetical protein
MKITGWLVSAIVFLVASLLLWASFGSKLSGLYLALASTALFIISVSSCPPFFRRAFSSPSKWRNAAQYSLTVVLFGAVFAFGIAKSTSVTSESKRALDEAITADIAQLLPQNLSDDDKTFVRRGVLSASSESRETVARCRVVGRWIVNANEMNLMNTMRQKLSEEVQSPRKSFETKILSPKIAGILVGGKKYELYGDRIGRIISGTWQAARNHAIRQSMPTEQWNAAIDSAEKEDEALIQSGTLTPKFSAELHKRALGDISVEERANDTAKGVMYVPWPFDSTECFSKINLKLTLAK